MNTQEANSFFSRYIHASFKITPAKPAYIQGLRVAFLLGLPVLLGLYFNRSSEAFLLMFATLNVTLVDMGGMTYRKTARILLIATLLNAIAAIVAQWASFHILTASVITVVWLAAVAMLGLLGNSGVMMAFVNSAVFVIIVSNPDSQATTMNTFIVFIVGGLWAMLLSLIAWPVRAYQPIRKAIADCFLANAAFLRNVATPFQDENSSEKPDHKNTSIDMAHHDFREKIDKAYEMISNKRQGRFSNSEVEDDLISLLHNISKDHRSIMALMVWFKKESSKTELLRSNEIEGFFHAVADIQTEISGLIIYSSISEHDILTKIDSLEEEYSNKMNQIASSQVKEIVSDLRQLLERVRSEVFLAVKQKPSFKPKNTNVRHQHLEVDNKPSFFTLLRNNLTFKSAGFRHALRISITSAIAVLLAHIIHMPHSYWIPLTAVVIMAPDFGGSFLIRTLQRGAGTILGGLLAVLLISQVQSQLLIIFILIISTFLAISMLTINYAVFVFFLTPLIVMMYSISDIGDWHIPLDRVLDTLLGIALTLIGGRLLFPDWERNHFHDRISSMLNATDSYFNTVISSLTGEKISPSQLISLGRKMELAASNANASLQRTLTQPGFSKELITPMMTFLSSSNLLMQSVIRLHEYTVTTNDKIENPEEYLKAGRKISELLELISENILLQKSKENHTNNILVDMVNEMQNIEVQIKAILKTISEDNLPATEFKLLAAAEYGMMTSLSLYLSKYTDVDIQDTPVFDL